MDGEREKLILELDEYIALCKSRLNAILSTLEWNEEDTLQLKENTCLRGGLSERKDDKNDPALPESFDCMHSIVIGEDQLKLILKTDKVSIPKRFSDIQLNYTKEQKRELYDYVIFNTGKISEPELKVSVSNENQTGHDMTFAEIVAKAKKRDKKLKRKYRTSKPTHIEEVRNLVHLQMQALAQYFNPKSNSSEESEIRGGRDEEKLRDVRRPRRMSESRSRDRKRSRDRGRSRTKESTDRKYGKRDSHTKSRRERDDSRSMNRNQSRDRRSRSKHRRSRSRDSRSYSRDRRSWGKERRSRSRNKRTTNPSSSSPTSTHTHRHKHKSSSSQKSKKHSKSCSKNRHKSSKSKKSHREKKSHTETVSGLKHSAKDES